MARIDESLEKLESTSRDNKENVQVLHDNQSELKTLEDVLLTRLLDLKYIKTSQQIYANLSDLFSKDLQNYCTKLRDPKIKRLSADFASDLTQIRACVQDAEERFGSLMAKKDRVKELIRELLKKQRELDSIASGLESWLNEIEHKIEKTSSTPPVIASPVNKKGSGSGDTVRELEELSDVFKLLRADIQQQRKPVEEFQKCGRSLGEESEYGRRALSVQDRYQRVEKLVTEKLDHLIEKLTCARNLKENFELTNSWLNEIDQVYLSSNGSKTTDLNEKLLNGNHKTTKSKIFILTKLKIL
jgi:methyl-accepting chemotaxis protein